eukprot:COSAG01_NODE_2241_length_8086_cov_25.173282_2_plen_247_part_00
MFFAPSLQPFHAYQSNGSCCHVGVQSLAHSRPVMYVLGHVVSEQHGFCALGLCPYDVGTEQLSMVSTTRPLVQPWPRRSKSVIGFANGKGSQGHSHQGSGEFRQEGRCRHLLLDLAPHLWDGKRRGRPHVGKEVAASVVPPQHGPSLLRVPSLGCPEGHLPRTGRPLGQARVLRVRTAQRGVNFVAFVASNAPLLTPPSSSACCPAAGSIIQFPTGKFFTSPCPRPSIFFRWEGACSHLGVCRGSD